MVPDVDGIQIKPKSKHIWIDHCSLCDYDDGLIDITRESTDITISRFGKVHLYNNYTRNWGIYAVCASVESQIYSQCNIYEAGQKKVAFKYLTEKVWEGVQVTFIWKSYNCVHRCRS
ncbi:putative pectate lyase 21 [Camellia lanceoleosa]|uniref:Pectate lyase 21 n=1 Tax=Camellia lanceoleosa TaxID=1840588 RepID=A0ACC0I191_9ERIC|nr:putative pectate lyase 21 [Camellia lanceoleosa]